MVSKTPTAPWELDRLRPCRWTVVANCRIGELSTAGSVRPRYILNFSFYSTSQQVIEKSVWITVYPHLLGALAHLLGALSALIGGGNGTC
jgi:hypothetical protein